MSGVLGNLDGIPIKVSPFLRYDEMYVGDVGLVVGETRHLVYRMKMIDLNNECRRSAGEHIKARARHILGEDWKLSH